MDFTSQELRGGYLFQGEIINLRNIIKQFEIFLVRNLRKEPLEERYDHNHFVCYWLRITNPLQNNLHEARMIRSYVIDRRDGDLKEKSYGVAKDRRASEMTINVSHHATKNCADRIDIELCLIVKHVITTY